MGEAIGSPQHHLIQSGAGIIISNNVPEITYISENLLNFFKKIDATMPLTFPQLKQRGFVIPGKEAAGPAVKIINLPSNLGHIRIATAPLYNDDKKMTGTISIIEDTTHNMALEREILLQNKKLEIEMRTKKEVDLFAELSPLPIIRLRANGQINLANPVAVKLFNTDKVNWTAIDQNIDQKTLGSLIVNNTGLTHEFINAQKFYLVTYMGSKEFNTINAYCVDITHLKSIKHELEQERAQREELSKMAILGEMAGGLAHEVNNPLAVTTLSLGQIKKILMKDDPIDNDFILEIISDAMLATFRIEKIVECFMSYSSNKTSDRFMSYNRNKTGDRFFSYSRNKICDNFIFTNIKEIIDESFLLYRGILKKNKIHYDIVYFDEYTADWSIQCNPTQLMQVIVNFIRNAKDAISSLDEKWIKIEVQNINDGHTLQIIDSGKGISKKIQKKLFHPFFTTKEIGEGTGLGLNVSYGIIKNHRGKLYYKPENENTTFVIELPRRQKELSELPMATDHLPTRSGPPETLPDIGQL